MKCLFEHRAAFPVTQRKAGIAGLLRVLAIGALAVLSVNAGEWKLGVVEGASGGRYSSFQIDRSGNAHVCSYGPTNNTLSYAFWDHAINRWFTTDVGSSSGFCSLVLDSQQHPHISDIEYGTGRLKYTHWDGASWKTQAIPIQARSIAYNTSIALDSEDRPNIALYEEFSLGVEKTFLRIVVWNGRFWELRTVDFDEGSGKFNSMAINSAHLPLIAYANVAYQNAGLRFANWNGRSWDREIIEGQSGPAIIYSVEMALDKTDVPHIAYTDVLNRLIKYAVKRHGKWELEVVGQVNKVGYPDRNGIALDEQGKVYISYYDAGSGELKLAYKQGQNWINEVVDRQFAGFASCLRIAGGSIWLTYQDETGEELRYARRPLTRGSIGAKSDSPDATSKKPGERER